MSASSCLAVLATFRERRYAASRCRELVRLYADVSRARPSLTRESRYREVVCMFRGIGPTAAEVDLEQASQSYASWPVERDLVFRDVAHYLVVAEFLATHKDSHWFQTNIKSLVDSLVPREL